MELRERFWDLQTMEPPDQIEAMVQLTIGLKNDSKQISTLVELFISAGALNEFDSVRPFLVTNFARVFITLFYFIVHVAFEIHAIRGSFQRSGKRVASMF